jgi:hypothetical protein
VASVAYCYQMTPLVERNSTVGHYLPDCNDPDSRDPYCLEPTPEIIAAAQAQACAL